MNVLLLSQLFSSTRGGGEYVFSLLAKKLAENGHNVHIITNRIKDEEYHKIKNIELIFVPPLIEYRGGIPPNAVQNLRYSINAFFAGLNIIRKKKIDLIHSNNFAPALAGSALSTFTGRPHIITIHDVLSLCGKNYWKIWGAQQNAMKVNLLIASFMDRLIPKLRHACIHTVSEATKEDLVKFGEKKPIHVIHNAVENISTDDSICPNPFQFVYVGRLLFSKNIEVAIRAVGIAKKKIPQIKLVVIGQGPHRKTLENIVKGLGLESNVEFRGHLSDEEKIRILQESCALVFPSICEGFGIVILEAFACKRPALVSNVKPLSDIVTHEKNGFVIDPYDATAWAEYLVKMIKDMNQPQKMGENGHRLLKEKLTHNSMYDKIMKMYYSV
jgi:glycosyltransferase involved in cell wall biosynthesis